MTLTYLMPLQDAYASPLATQLTSEEKEYAARLREVENALLCQALGGQMPQPDNQIRLQRYLDGEISRIEAFQPLFPVANRWAN
jgi:hypothetical protein